MGYSAGGPQAIAYAATHLRRAEKLILYGTRAYFDPAGRALRLAIGALIRAHWGLASKTLADVFMGDASLQQVEAFAARQVMMASPEVAAGLWDGAIETDVRALCGRVRIPTLVLHREGDAVVPINLGQDLGALIPTARFVALAGGPHSVELGDSETVLRLIAEFLGDPYEAPSAHETPAATAPGAQHAVFISYASEDHAAADAVAHALEAAGIACWIAPRDIRPGADYAEAIIDAIRTSKALLLLFSQHANRSPHVRREVERAVSLDVPLLPVRLDATTPARGMEYFLSTAQWFDAFPQPVASYTDRLVATTGTLVGSAEPQRA